MPLDRNEMAARYWDLCEYRDSVNAGIVDVQAELDRANAEAMAAQQRAEKLKAQIEAARGGPEWLTIKKEIADIARFFGRVPPRVERETKTKT